MVSGEEMAMVSRGTVEMYGAWGEGRSNLLSMPSKPWISRKCFAVAVNLLIPWGCETAAGKLSLPLPPPPTESRVLMFGR